jgi:predicted RecA/RadA family phage recombinase
MINFVKSGDTLTLSAPYDVLSGGGFKVGNVFGVAANDTLSGADVTCEVEGVYDLAKDASVFAQGDLAYWDDSAKKVTSTVGSNLLIGAVEVAAATGLTVVRVNLFSVPGFSGQAHGLKVAYAKYDFSVDGGASCTPTVSDTIPINAVVFGGIVCSTTALAAAGAATLSIGTVAGSGAASFLAATGKASLGTNAMAVPTAVATPFKMTAAGKINVAVATGPLTAGVVEIWAFYTTAAA